MLTLFFSFELIKDKNMCRKNILFILIAILMLSLNSGCGSIKSKKLIYKTSEVYKPYTGVVKVFWKYHGVPADPNSYTLIATISGKPFWAGVYDAKDFEPLHKYIINKAAEVGANAVIMYCGEIDSVGASKCYGDAIWLK